MTDAVIFGNVDIVFGDNPQRALDMVDEGKTRDEIGAATGLVLGVAKASLAVKEGEILVLMGLSGSGKSTLLRAVNALAPLCAAMSASRRTPVTSTPTRPRPSAAGPAHAHRLHGLPAVRPPSLADGGRQCRLRPGTRGVPEAERKERVAAQLELVNLSKWAERRVNELSGGMQQRVGLARAFATGAPILLMDEPFSALDPLIRTRLQDELLEFQARLKKTILFVSHDLDEAFRIGNRIAFMEGGRIIQCGTPQEIVQNPTNQYVADFVQNMNPINMLIASDVMRAGVASGQGQVTATLVRARRWSTSSTPCRVSRNDRGR